MTEYGKHGKPRSRLSTLPTLFGNPFGIATFPRPRLLAYFKAQKQERPNPKPLDLKGVVMEVLGPKCNGRSSTLTGWTTGSGLNRPKWLPLSPALTNWLLETSVRINDDRFIGYAVFLDCTTKPQELTCVRVRDGKAEKDWFMPASGHAARA